MTSNGGKRKLLLEEPQILRVRRRRDADESALLRVAPQIDTLLENWGLENTSSLVYYERSDSSKKRRKGDICDALLIEEDDRITTKRRKLQIIGRQEDRDDPSDEYPTLTPEQNKVNESLLMVFQGTRSLKEHCEMLQSTFEQWTEWMDWCCLSGTWLHAAALWNEDSLANTMLLHVDTSNILHCLDEEGHSALDIAKLSCNEEMIVLLERLEEESEFVYDFYEFRRPESINTTIMENELTVLDCELLRHNAVYNAGTAGIEDSDLMVPSAEPSGGEEEEADSNDEDWFTNDYPDEDSSSEGGGFRDYDCDGEFDTAYGDIYGQGGDPYDYDE